MKRRLMAAALISGLSVLAMIYTFGPISGAHFNPAVTLAFAAAKRFPGRDIAPYILTQFAGAISAAAFVGVMSQSGHGTHIPHGSTLQVVATEFALSFILMAVIAAVAQKQVHAVIPGLSIGLTVTMNVLIGGPITGGSMNPARSFGPALIAGGEALHSSWLYLLVPPIGAIAGALMIGSLIQAQPSATSS